MVFTEEDGNTAVDDSIELESRFLTFIIRFFSRWTKSAVKENLLKLKELLETGFIRVLHFFCCFVVPLVISPLQRRKPPDNETS